MIWRPVLEMAHILLAHQRVKSCISLIEGLRKGHDFRLTVCRIRSKINRFMIKVYALIASCLSFIALTLLSSLAHAQFIPESELKKLPPEVALQLQKIPVKDILSGKTKIKPTLPSYVEKDPEWVNNLPITLHLRGQQGTALPKAEKLRAARKEAAKKEPPTDSSSIQLLSKASNDFKERLSKIAPLPECRRDQKVFTEYATPNGEGILQDILFIKPEQVPLDSDEAFGSDTIVIKYAADSSSSWTHFAALEGIKCLPSRIRILGRGSYRLEGMPALKNYQNDLYGEGVLSDVIKANANKFLTSSEGGL